jgi:hypothetical protein
MNETGGAYKSYGEALKESKQRFNEKQRLAEDKVLETGDPGERVLETGKKICFSDRKIIMGSCWDFVNAVYNEAGYTGNRRLTIFKRQGGGAFADTNIFRPGDWLMHINLEFGNVEHSGIFVKWEDRANNIATMLDYAGMNRAEAGKYRTHNLSKVFLVLRAGIKH